MFSTTAKTLRWQGFDDLHARYDISNIILGKGSYGVVYKGTDRVTNEPVAVKKMAFKGEYFYAQRYAREITLLRQLGKHPAINTLKYVAASADSDASTPLKEIVLVLEYCATNLERVIDSKQPLTLKHIKYIVYQIFSGMHHIHSAKVVHRDLKPANILINGDCTIRIGDFGFARALETISISKHVSTDAPPHPFKQLTGYVLSRWYRSPEVMLNEPAGFATDIWSIGCILAELIKRKPLFPGKNHAQMMAFILDLLGPQSDCDWIKLESGRQFVLRYISKSPRTIQQTFANTDASVLALLTALLAFNPIQRPTAEQALQHACLSEWFNPRDLVPFSFQATSASEQCSLLRYYAFEERLDKSPQEHPTSSRLIQLAADLIHQETTAYVYSSAKAPLPPAPEQEPVMKFHSNESREQASPDKTPTSPKPHQSNKRARSPDETTYTPGWFKPQKRAAKLASPVEQNKDTGANDEINKRVQP